MSSGGGNSGSSSGSPKWESVPKDSRYEQKIIEKSDGSITRVTRQAGQTSEYPHYTEMYKNGSKNTHQSDNKSTHNNKVHRTGNSVLKDLGLDD